MQDRISQNPGRVRITPEDGSPSFFATVTMADNPTQTGTPPTKANLLTDATATALSLDNDATVNDALFKLYDNDEWHVLADVTVAEQSHDKIVTLSDDLLKYKEFILLGNAPSPGAGYEMAVYLGTNNMGTSLMSRSVILSTADPAAVIKGKIINIYGGLIYTREGENLVYVLSESESRNVYLVGYRTTDNLYPGSRFVVIARGKR